MATCKECVHYVICQNEAFKEARFSVKAETVIVTIKDRIACKFFQNKADFVEVKWISVKDRLPKNEERVLVAVDSDKSTTKIDTDRMVYRQWVRWVMSVTHWMPLPEPPMKEGAE